jgi:cytidylate kinase
MSGFRSEQAIKAYLSSQIRERSGAAPEAGPQPAGFVTISRETGAGGVAVAERLATELNAGRTGGGVPWTVFDRELVEIVRRDHSLPEKLSGYLTEDAFPEMKAIIDDLFGFEESVSSIVRKTSRTILRLARLGNAILVGRGANIVTRELEGGHHVRLVAPMPQRIAEVMKAEGLDRRQAEKSVKKQDTAKHDYVEDNFSRDVGDPLLYDLVINTGHGSLGRAVASIRAILEHRE